MMVTMSMMMMTVMILSACLFAAKSIVLVHRSQSYLAVRFPEVRNRKGTEGGLVWLANTSDCVLLHIIAQFVDAILVMQFLLHIIIIAQFVNAILQCKIALCAAYCTGDQKIISTK